MTKRTVKQIEESLWRKLSEATDDINDPMNIGGRDGKPMQIDIGLGGTGRGSKKPRVSLQRAKEMGLVKTDQSPTDIRNQRVGAKVWRTGDPATSTDIRNQRVGAKVWRTGPDATIGAPNPAGAGPVVTVGAPNPAGRGPSLSPAPSTPQERMVAQAQQHAADTGEGSLIVNNPRLSKFLDATLGRWADKPSSTTTKAAPGKTEPKLDEAGEKTEQEKLDAIKRRFIAGVIGAESSGQETAKNPRSTATGIGQFILGTFQGMVKQAKPGSPLYNKSWEDYKEDLVLQKHTLDIATDGYIKKLQANKLPVTPGNLYMLHHFDPDTAIRALKNPDAKMSDFWPETVIKIDKKTGQPETIINPVYSSNPGLGPNQKISKVHSRLENTVTSPARIDLGYEALANVERLEKQRAKEKADQAVAAQKMSKGYAAAAKDTDAFAAKSPGRKSDYSGFGPSAGDFAIDVSTGFEKPSGDPNAPTVVKKGDPEWDKFDAEYNKRQAELKKDLERSEKVLQKIDKGGKGKTDKEEKAKADVEPAAKAKDDTKTTADARKMGSGYATAASKTDAAEKAAKSAAQAAPATRTAKLNVGNALDYPEVDYFGHIMPGLSGYKQYKLPDGTVITDKKTLTDIWSMQRTARDQRDAKAKADAEVAAKAPASTASAEKTPAPAPAPKADTSTDKSTKAPTPAPTAPKADTSTDKSTKAPTPAPKADSAAQAPATSTEKPPVATTTPDKKTTAPSWQDIYKANKDVIGSDPNIIKPGQVLKLPNGETYTVKKGDTLGSIAGEPAPAKSKTVGKKADSTTPSTINTVAPKYEPSVQAPLVRPSATTNEPAPEPVLAPEPVITPPTAPTSPSQMEPVEISATKEIPNVWRDTSGAPVTTGFGEPIATGSSDDIDVAAAKKELADLKKLSAITPPEPTTKSPGLVDRLNQLADLATGYRAAPRSELNRVQVPESVNTENNELTDILWLSGQRKK